MHALFEHIKTVYDSSVSMLAKNGKAAIVRRPRLYFTASENGQKAVDGGSDPPAFRCGDAMVAMTSRGLAHI